jgi:UDP-N-acetylglucosamine 2-epimerase (non-hydrolysing)
MAVNVFRPMLIFGTRPEAIKMAPIVHECRQRAGEIAATVCLTGQHREMLRQVTDYFQIEADVDLELMQPDQTLAGLTARCITGIDEQLAKIRPHCVVAQGDTTTVMAASLAAFYRRVPFVHVEAGLRTGNLQAPWPEEMNRRVAGITAALHCAPTSWAAANLRREGVSDLTIRVTGNTVIDALLYAARRERADADRWRTKYAMLGDQRMVLVTGHRRENFGGGFEEICRSIAKLARQHPEIAFLYPVHLNPHVQEPVRRLLGSLENVFLTAPAPYPEFVWLMDRSTVILTDSGGVQEEAPSLGKPVLVMRETTERPEAMEAGAVQLVGTSFEKITTAVTRLLTDEAEYRRHQIDVNPYGDGQAARRTVDFMLEQGWGMDRALE